MKTVSLVLILCILLSCQALANSPASPDLLTEAQKYGETHAQTIWTDFAYPWSSFEERAGRLDDAAEVAYLYTPYLLIAADTKEKILTKQTVNRQDAEKILNDYKGYLVFSVKLFGNSKDFAQGCVAVVKQEQKNISVYQSTIPPEAMDTGWSPKEPLFFTQCYFYFLDNEINASNPIRLEIVKANTQLRSFYFDLSRIK